MSPVVTVGIPVFNGEEYLPLALRSTQEQDLADIEILISDNGSTDATEEICRAAAAEDSRIRYLRSPENRGGAWNYQRVARLSRAPLFSWMAADDVKDRAFLTECVDALGEVDGAVFACTRTQLIDAEGLVFEDLDDKDMGLDAATPHERVRNLLRNQASHVMYGVIRKDALQRTRGLLPCVGDDMVLLTELLCQGPMALGPGQHFHQRRHAKQFSAQGENQVKWHAPDAKTRFAFPQTRLNVELFAAVRHADLPLGERVRTWSTIAPSWTLPRWRGVASDFRIALGVPPRQRKV